MARGTNAAVADEQTEMPGFEQEKIAEIERAAGKLDEKRRLWQGLGDELVNAQTLLRELMHKHSAKLDSDGAGSLTYSRGDIHVTVTVKEKIKVKIDAEDEPEEE